MSSRKRDIWTSTLHISFLWTWQNQLSKSLLLEEYLTLVSLISPISVVWTLFSFTLTSNLPTFNFPCHVDVCKLQNTILILTWLLVGLDEGLPLVYYPPTFEMQLLFPVCLENVFIDTSFGYCQQPMWVIFIPDLLGYCYFTIYYCHTPNYYTLVRGTKYYWLALKVVN